MLKVIWNIVKSVLSLILRVFRPCRGLVCRRLRLSDADSTELTSIGTGDLHREKTNLYGIKQNEQQEEVEMEAWDSWTDQPNRDQSGNPQTTPAPAHPSPPTPHMNGQPARQSSSIHNYYYHQKLAQPDPEPEADLFGDMVPKVKKQPKILIRKNDNASPNSTESLVNRMAVMSDVPLATSELGAWDEEGPSAWDATGEVLEDLTWQAEEAIRENRRRERMDRQMEQQRRKQRKEEMRGVKQGGGALVATKLS